MRWLQVHVYEGFYVDFLVEDDTVWVKEWEFGDVEPDWDTVKATPVQPPKPGSEIW